MATEQQTLTGDTTDAERSRPDTMVYCIRCGDWVLRSNAGAHENVRWPEPDEESEEGDDFTAELTW